MDTRSSPGLPPRDRPPFDQADSATGAGTAALRHSSNPDETIGYGVRACCASLLREPHWETCPNYNREDRDREQFLALVLEQELYRVLGIKDFDATLIARAAIAALAEARGQA
jgi:hypothetical protein